MKTRDIDIRTSLCGYLEEKFSYDQTTKIIHELNVCYGSARVDVAAINGSFYGFEIKSDSDTLDRLPQQVEYYNKVFDFITLVCSENFINDAKKIIPEWWGLCIPTLKDGDIFIENIREPDSNNNIDPYSLTQFLWKDEAIRLLASPGADKKLNRLPKYALWDLLSKTCPLEKIKNHVRSCLKQRDNWRLD